MKLNLVHQLATIDDQTMEPTYIRTPPVYAPICGRLAEEAGQSHNLMSEFVDMHVEGHGLVLRDVEFLSDTRWVQRFKSPPTENESSGLE